MNILITCGNRMFDRTLRSEFQAHEVLVADLPEAAGADTVYRSYKPDALIHCAVMTTVKCETNPDSVMENQRRWFHQCCIRLLSQ